MKAKGSLVACQAGRKRDSTAWWEHATLSSLAQCLAYRSGCLQSISSGAFQFQPFSGDPWAFPSWRPLGLCSGLRHQAKVQRLCGARSWKAR